MNVRKTNKRKAISPVLATVILIAITLVAGVAIAGFAFGLFGSLSSSANVQIVTESCPVAAGNNTCALSWTNTGSAPASADSCTIYGGAAVLGVVAGTPATVPLAAGSHGVMDCQYTDAGTETAGTSLTGQVVLSNGATITFNSVWT